LALEFGSSYETYWERKFNGLLFEVCVLGCGLAGTGIAFFGGYVFYWFLIYAIVRSVSGFRWSAANKQIGLIYAVMIAGVFGGWYFLPLGVVVVGGTLAAFGAGVYSLRTLCTLIPLDRLPRLGATAHRASAVGARGDSGLNPKTAVG